MDLWVQTRPDEPGRLHREGGCITVLHGHIFSNRRDEPARDVLEGYLQSGLGFFRDLDGEFSLVLWDSRSGWLIAVRDSFGLKPLYFFEGPLELIIGTECRDITRARGDGEGLDERTLLQAVDSQEVEFSPTAYRGVRRLRPAHATVFDVLGRTGRTIELWRPSITGPSGPQRGHGDGRMASEGLRGHLREAVRRRIGPREVGLTLSGGLDSTSVLLAASAEGIADRVHALTMAFPEMGCDESAVARSIAGEAGADTWESIDGRRSGSLQVAKLAASMCDRPANGALTHVVLWGEAVAARGLNTCILGIGGDEFLEDGTYGADYAFLGHQLLEFLCEWVRTPREAFKVAGFVARRAAIPFVRFVLESALERRDAGGLGEVWPSLSPGDLTPGAFLMAKRFALLTWSLQRSVYENIEQVLARYRVDPSFPLLDRSLVDFVLSLPWVAITGYRDRKHLLRRALEPWTVVDRLSEKGTVTFGEPMRPLLDLAPKAMAILEAWFASNSPRSRIRRGIALRGSPGLPAVWTCLWLEARGFLEPGTLHAAS